MGTINAEFDYNLLGENGNFVEKDQGIPQMNSTCRCIWPLVCGIGYTFS